MGMRLASLKIFAIVYLFLPGINNTNCRHKSLSTLLRMSLSTFTDTMPLREHFFNLMPSIDPIVRQIRLFLCQSLTHWPLSRLGISIGFFLLTFIESIYNLYGWIFKRQFLWYNDREKEADAFINDMATSAFERSMKSVDSKDHYESTYNQEKPRNAIVTGGTSGIGREMVIALYLAGYHVHIPCRDMIKAKKIKKEIVESYPLGVERRAEIHLYQCDLASFRNVLQFVKEFRQHHETLFILINNAGIYSSRFSFSPDNFELHMAIHVVAPVLLIRELLPCLEQGSLQDQQPVRIINISSSSLFAVTDFNPFDALFTLRYSGHFSAYSISKYALTLATLQLDREINHNLISMYIVHPGMVNTDITRDDWLATLSLKGILQTFLPFLVLTPKQGALSAIWLASKGYCNNQENMKYLFHDFQWECVSDVLIRDYRNGTGARLLELIDQAIE